MRQNDILGVADADNLVAAATSVLQSWLSRRTDGFLTHVAADMAFDGSSEVAGFRIKRLTPADADRYVFRVNEPTVAKSDVLLVSRAEMSTDGLCEPDVCIFLVAKTRELIFYVEVDGTGAVCIPSESHERWHVAVLVRHCTAIFL
jgi:hypothetical protein